MDTNEHTGRRARYVILRRLALGADLVFVALVALAYHQLGWEALLYTAGVSVAAVVGAWWRWTAGIGPLLDRLEQAVEQELQKRQGWQS